MTRANFNRRLRQLHLWLGLAIGAQVGLWLISGLFMTWFSIDNVRGDHLRNEQVPTTLSANLELLTIKNAIVKSGFEPTHMAVKILADTPVWYLENEDNKMLINAVTGERLSPLNKAIVQSIATKAYRGEGQLSIATLLDNPPREYGRAGPVWQIEFDKPQPATFYVDATNGDIKAVRTGLWRTFDFMWGLHIMDWSTRENFNSWWIKMTASLAVLFFLAGMGLAILRVNSMIKRRR